MFRMITTKKGDDKNSLFLFQKIIRCKAFSAVDKSNKMIVRFIRCYVSILFSMFYQEKNIMSYELMRITDKDINTKVVEYEVVKRFNEEEKEYIDNCLTNLNYFQVFAFSWSAILNNLKDVKGIVKEFSIDYQGTLSGTRDRPKYASRVSDTIRFTSNFLSSVNQLLALIESNIKCKEIKKKWEIRKRKLHAENLCYRLSYELRNHSQHKGIPISYVQANNIGLEGACVKLYLDRQAILLDENSKNKLKSYVEEFEKDVELIHVFDEYVLVIAQLLNYFKELNVEYYQSLTDFYNEYSKHLTDDSSLYYVSKNVADKDILKNMTKFELGAFEWVLGVMSKVSISK